MLDIDRELSERYDIEIKDMIPYKDAFIISSSKGKKLLKKSLLSADRIWFIHGAKEHLHNNGFPNIDRYVCTMDGEPFVRVNDEIFVLADFTDGRECNFDSRADVITASRLLAGMHRASKGYKQPVNSGCRDDLGKMPVYFGKRLDEIKKLRKAAKKGKNKFDYLFLENVDYFQNVGEKSLQLINGNRYEQLVQRTRAEGIFCHHDFTHHNIICGEDKAVLTNFDFCCYELKVYDVANFLRRKMRKCNWDIDEAKVIIKEYCKIESLSEDEIFVLRVLLEFPQKFWRVINKYYNSNHSWSEKSYINKLQEVIDEIYLFNTFIEQYETLFQF